MPIGRRLSTIIPRHVMNEHRTRLRSPMTADDERLSVRFKEKMAHESYEPKRLDSAYGPTVMFHMRR